MTTRSEAVEAVAARFAKELASAESTFGIDRLAVLAVNELAGRGILHVGPLPPRPRNDALAHEVAVVLSTGYPHRGDLKGLVRRLDQDRRAAWDALAWAVGGPDRPAERDPDEPVHQCRRGWACPDGCEAEGDEGTDRLSHDELNWRNR